MFHIKLLLFSQDLNNFGTLVVSGYLKGLPMSVNGLVHIPGFGDYQMSLIEECKDPFSIGSEKKISAPDFQVDVADISKQVILFVPDSINFLLYKID